MAVCEHLLCNLGVGIITNGTPLWFLYNILIMVKAPRLLRFHILLWL